MFLTQFQKCNGNLLSLVSVLQDFTNIFKDLPFKFNLFISCLFVENADLKNKEYVRQLEGLMIPLCDMIGESKAWDEFVQDYRQRKKKRKNVLKRVIKT